MYLEVEGTVSSGFVMRHVVRVRSVAVVAVAAHALARAAAAAAP
jgi:hypothetical protein